MSSPYVQARYTIISVIDLGGTPQQWEIEGEIYDSAFGFSPYDVQVGDLVFDESPWDFVVNRWSVQSVVTAGSPNWNSLKVNVQYAEEGTPGGLFGEPQPCDAALCRIPVNGWQVGQRPTQGWHQLSETLLNYIRNIDLQEIQKRVNKAVVDWALVTASRSVDVGTGWYCDTTGGAFTLTFPASPVSGNSIYLLEVGGVADQYPVTVDGNGNDIMGDSTFELDTNNTGLQFTFVDSTYGWRVFDTFGTEC